MAAADGGGNSDNIVNLVLVALVVIILVWKAFEGSRGKPSKAKSQPQSGNAEFDDADDGAAAEQDFEDDISEHPEGEELELDISELHFGLARCRVMGGGDLVPMPKLMKCPLEDLMSNQLEVARVHIGTFRVWVIQGTKSNRILYAMKKREDVTGDARCVVVPPPPPRPVNEEDDQEFPDTYGTDLAKIQLIP
eukprot:TRINITY_DN14461_c0_g1_i2.p1 TRINITY_DN14461_c0_g1~~TRINITY_DN14461_c0_g1_i2.p1  ORF type:complete len:193 (-),score=53.40 TRINITY_DN14461_c0_g1_i2:101-679(-)